MEEIIELLKNPFDGLSDYESFKAKCRDIAGELFTSYGIECNNKIFRLAEIEFYYYDSEQYLKDPSHHKWQEVTYPRNDYKNLKIVSDWKWYLQVIALGGEQPVYVDIDVTLFDMLGISETNKELNQSERRQVLGQLLPKAVLADYEQYAFPMEQIQRLKRHPWAYKMVWFLERCLFKMEKAKDRRKRSK